MPDIVVCMYCVCIHLRYLIYYRYHLPLSTIVHIYAMCPYNTRYSIYIILCSS